LTIARIRPLFATMMFVTMALISLVPRPANASTLFAIFKAVSAYIDDAFKASRAVVINGSKVASKADDVVGVGVISAKIIADQLAKCVLRAQTNKSKSEATAFCQDKYLACVVENGATKEQELNEQCMQETNSQLLVPEKNFSH
jgi:hypothetical protein